MKKIYFIFSTILSLCLILSSCHISDNTTLSNIYQYTSNELFYNTFEKSDSLVFAEYSETSVNGNETEYIFLITDVIKGDLEKNKISVLDDKTDRCYMSTNEYLEKYNISYEKNQEYLLSLYKDEYGKYRFYHNCFYMPTANPQISRINDLNISKNFPSSLISYATNRNELKESILYQLQKTDGGNGKLPITKFMSRLNLYTGMKKSREEYSFTSYNDVINKFIKSDPNYSENTGFMVAKVKKVNSESHCIYDENTKSEYCFTITTLKINDVVENTQKSKNVSAGDEIKILEYYGYHDNILCANGHIYHFKSDSYSNLLTPHALPTITFEEYPNEQIIIADNTEYLMLFNYSYYLGENNSKVQVVDELLNTLVILPNEKLQNAFASFYAIEIDDDSYQMAKQNLSKYDALDNYNSTSITSLEAYERTLCIVYEYLYK